LNNIHPINRIPIKPADYLYKYVDGLTFIFTEYMASNSSIY